LKLAKQSQILSFREQDATKALKDHATKALANPAYAYISLNFVHKKGQRELLSIVI
jgi:hypothetical protein